MAWMKSQAMHFPLLEMWPYTPNVPVSSLDCSTLETMKIFIVSNQSLDIAFFCDIELALATVVARLRTTEDYCILSPK